MRERLDFQARGVSAALDALASRASAREAAVLSTCNRAEIYAACDDYEATRTDLLRFLSEFHDVDPSWLLPHVYEAADLEVARHLFRVAAGLDSLVVGEPQILGQVKEAHASAARARVAGPTLNRLFQSSFGVGKRVRTETALGSGAVSVSFAAVSLARKIFGDLKGRSVLVIGAGEMGKLTALHMKSQGAQRVTIVSRSLARAARTAEAIGGASAAPWEELDALLGESDIVITADRRFGPHPHEGTAGDRDAVPAQPSAVHHRHRRAPRRGAFSRRHRTGVPVQHRRLAGDGARKRGAPRGRRSAAPRTSLGKKSRSSRRGSVRAEPSRRLSPFASGSKPSDGSSSSGWSSSCRTLTPEARARVDEITRLLVEKLLLTPTEQLKALGDAETVNRYSEALSRLFDLAAAEADGLSARAGQTPSNASGPDDSTASGQGSSKGPGQPGPGLSSRSPERGALGRARTRVPSAGASARNARQPARSLAGPRRGLEESQRPGALRAG